MVSSELWNRWMAAVCKRVGNGGGHDVAHSPIGELDCSGVAHSALDFTMRNFLDLALWLRHEQQQAGW
jgi:hypothetical protein